MTRLLSLSVAVFLLSSLTWAQSDTIYYTERAWDSDTKSVVETLQPLYPDDYQLVNSSNDMLTFTSGNYVVRDTVHLPFIFIDGEVRIILCDSAVLDFDKPGGIQLNNASDKLYIYDQPGEAMGKMDMNKEYARCGIHSRGLVEIHGGDIDINTFKYNYPNLDYFSSVAAIGNTVGDGYSGTYKFFGGKIVARGGNGCAGIGGDTQPAGEMGTIEIYGGDIEAYGGNEPAFERFSSAGIGGGDHTTSGQIHIYGGNVKAVGGRQGAGIGTSEHVSETDLGTHTIEIIIDCGTVEARGDKFAAGIGGGDGIDNYRVTINGGHVEAYGGVDAAGIGGGEGGDGGTVTITGGYVYAEGNDNGTGIGGGEDGDGADVTITGGTVIAKTTGNYDRSKAIGMGNGSFFTPDIGTLTIGDTLRVRVADPMLTPPYGNPCLAEKRQDFAWYNRDVLIEPCPHHTYTCTSTGNTSNDTHTIHCRHCLYTHTELHHFENGVCTVCGATEEDTPTGLEDGVGIGDGHWQKVLRNGMLVIEKNGKLYNALGVEVK